MRARLSAVVVAVAVATGAWAADGLDHRVWLAEGAVDAAATVDLTAAGVDGFVVPVGSARIETGSTTFTSRGQARPVPAPGASIAAAVWVAGEGEARGDAASFWGQVAPSARGLGDVGALVLVAPVPWEGLPSFAGAVARASGLRVELMISAVELAAAAPRGGWPDVRALAVAFGHPANFSFPDSPIDDDLDALEKLDRLGVDYRVALVIVPWSEPVPGPGRLNLRPLTSGDVVGFNPGGVDVFTLRKALDWGGTTLAAGASLKIRATTAARYARDLGLLLRPVHDGLLGWDTVALPPPEPAAGMSREAFLDFLRGGTPFPRPQVTTRWLSGTRLEIAVANPGPHRTAFGLTSNFVEVAFRGAALRDLQLGDFSTIRYGVAGDGRWRSVDAPRSADAVRLGFLALPARELLGGAVVTFMEPPRAVRVRWGLLPGDGTQVTGPYEAVSSPGR